MILDGEAVVLDEDGRSNFGALPQALGTGGGKRNAGEAMFLAFDLLYFDGHDLRKRIFNSADICSRPSFRIIADGAIRLSDPSRPTATSCSLRLASTDSRGLSPRGSTRPKDRAVSVVGSRSNASKATGFHYRL